MNLSLLRTPGSPSAPAHSRALPFPCKQQSRVVPFSFSQRDEILEPSVRLEGMRRVPGGLTSGCHCWGLGSRAEHPEEPRAELCPCPQTFWLLLLLLHLAHVLPRLLQELQPRGALAADNSGAFN